MDGVHGWIYWLCLIVFSSQKQNEDMVDDILHSEM